eukprot:Plantae.Rhodophyta-Palmaria_palmata.ctg9910.p1 GENE.Plantae.Rhodophyta-Palmaria_palmata.ctg9910~~Plantae.Rhodophyta-Palmaria_palmata.ctg9910.p1  ORF type:complete len:257 (-),score=26.19 Plantae.Rhodophyta-Palmaria_palmata.ctg9910:74-796(-)
MDKVGCDKSGDQAKGVCEVCQRGKQPRMPFGKTNQRKDYLPGEKLHTDLCGPISPTSEDRYSYVLTLTDDASRLTYVKTLRAKSETATEIENFVIATERQNGWKLKVLRSDRGGEFVNSTVGNFLKARGIKAELTPPYSPQMNGVAERVNRTLLGRSRCMILQSKLGKQFWSHALRHAAIIMNRLPRQVWMASRHSRSGSKVYQRWTCFAYLGVELLWAMLVRATSWPTVHVLNTCDVCD